MRNVIASIALLWLSAVTPADGQSCVGDCDGDGEVAINELILAVSIALGTSPIGQCPSIGPGPIGIDRLISSVNGALCACGPCPTPPPTRTPTATVAITATATRTSTQRPTPTARPPLFESVWREDNARLGKSTCSRDINDGIRSSFGTVNCPLDVARQGSFVEVTDCEGYYYSGSIDDAGVFRSSIELDEGAGGCSVTLQLDLAVNLSRSPSTATYSVAVDFAGSCGGLRDCQMTATTRWRRSSGTIAATSAHRSASGLGTSLLAGLSEQRGSH